jgi:Tetratricopeptide repeat
MKWQKLMQSGQYAEAIPELREYLGQNPNDIAAVEWMAEALRVIGRYGEALLFFQRLAANRQRDKVANIVAPGNPAWQIDISCLHWLCGDRTKATQLMHGLVAGILDGSIKYGDAAGGVSQGLLLYYMAVSHNKRDEQSFALDYLKNRVKRTSRRNWPSALASYCLGGVTFATVMEHVNDNEVRAVPPIDPETLELGRRIRLCDALFHDGVKSRAGGDEAYCLRRMRECAALENPVVEQEWYLARYEVEKADGQTSGR